MRAWQVHELGDPKSALTLREIENPEPGPGEVLVEVEAAALNFFDILLCQGKYQERLSPSLRVVKSRAPSRRSAMGWTLHQKRR